MPVCEDEWLSELLRFLRDPCVLCEFPVWRSTEEPVSMRALSEFRERAEREAGEGAEKAVRERMHREIRFPKGFPYLPILAGLNMLPLAQLLGSPGRSVNAFSATMGPDEARVLGDAARRSGCGFRVRRVSEIPFTFAACLIRHPREVSLPDIAEALRLVVEGGGKALAAVYRKEAARALYESMKGVPGVALYSQGDYGEMWGLTGTPQASEARSIVTYAGAAILQGENLREHDVLVADAGVYLRQIALGLDLDATAADIDRAMGERIWRMLLQTIGRLTRPSLAEEAARKRGETLRARKRIAIFLYNVPAYLSNFVPDERLFHELRTVPEGCVSENPRREAESIADSVLRCLRGENPQDWRDIDRRDMAEKAAAGGMDSLSKRERSLVDAGDLAEARQERKKAKSSKLEKEVRRLAAERMPWEAIRLKLHLGRYPEAKDVLRQAFEDERNRLP